jgi:hypothetical protein
VATVLLIPNNVFGISYNENGYPKQDMIAIFDSCNDGIWYGHFESSTGEQIPFGKVFLYDENFQRVHTTSLRPPEGTLQITLDGNEKYPKIGSVLIRSDVYEDYSFQPYCFELPSWMKSTALWWSSDAITDDDFILMIQFLVENRIIIVSSTDVASNNNGEIPTWVKTSAEWWGEGIITDMEFLRNIEYLINQGIIEIQNELVLESVQANNISIEIVECRVTKTGNYVKVGISATNMNLISVDVEYVLQTFDSSRKLLTMETSRMYDLMPSSTQFENGMLDNIGNLSSCGVHINKVSEN